MGVDKRYCSDCGKKTYHEYHEKDDWWECLECPEAIEKEKYDQADKADIQVKDEMRLDHSE